VMISAKRQEAHSPMRSAGEAAMDDPITRDKEKRRPKPPLWNFSGGPREARTRDLRVANAALSQLS
jgi:hypothetical protein